MWHAHRQTIGERQRRVGLDRTPRLERARIARRIRRHHTDDLDIQAQQISYRHHRADARTHADGHVHAIEIGHRREQLQGVGRDPGHEQAVERWHEHGAVRRRTSIGLHPGRIEVFTELHHLGAPGTHGRILVLRVAARHQHGHRQAVPRCRERHALAVVATCSSDQSRTGLAGRKVLHQIQATAHLEGAGGCVVFMLDPDPGAQPLAQQRPGQLWCGQHVPMHEPRGSVQFGARKQRLRAIGHRFLPDSPAVPVW